MNVDKNSFEEWNEKMAEEWDFNAYYNTPNLIIKYLEAKRTFWILKYLGAKDHERILEIGCGAGHILEKIERGILYGIDLSKRLIAIAGNRLGTRVELKRCNAEAIDYSDNFFDKVICADIIEHVLNPRNVFEEIRRIAKKDALVIISIPNDKIINRLRNILVKLGFFKLLFKEVPDERWTWHLHVFDISLLRNLTQGIFREMEIKIVPNKLLPLRYIIKYTVL